MDFTAVEKGGKWSVAEVSQFLELLTNYPALWDMSGSDYKLRDLKMESWRKLEEDLSAANFAPTISTAILKAKLKSVRDTYAVELKKVNKSGGTGTGGDKSSVLEKGKLYVPTLGWYKQADKLFRKSCLRRQSINTMSLPPRLLPENDALAEEDADEPDIEQTNDDDAMQTPSSQYIGRGSFRRGIKKSIQPAEDVSVIISRLERLASNKVDEYDGFGKSVAAMLRRLPRTVSWEVQDDIMRQLRVAVTRHSQECASRPRVEPGSSSCQTSSEANIQPSSPPNISNQRSNSFNDRLSNVTNPGSGCAQQSICTSRNEQSMSSSQVKIDSTGTSNILSSVMNDSTNSFNKRCPNEPVLPDSLRQRKRNPSEGSENSTCTIPVEISVKPSCSSIRPKANFAPLKTLHPLSLPTDNRLNSDSYISNSNKPSSSIILINPKPAVGRGKPRLQKENIKLSSMEQLMKQNPAFIKIFAPKKSTSFTPPKTYKCHKVVPDASAIIKNVESSTALSEEEVNNNVLASSVGIEID